MIVCVASTKGGVGKSTHAVNHTIGLSLAGQDVLLIDADPQGHSINFTDLRRARNEEGKPGYEVAALHKQEIETAVRSERRSHRQVVIDVGGTDNESLRYALGVSDLVLIPVPPRTLDVWGTEDMANLVVEARRFNSKLRAIAFLNQADPYGQDNEDAQEALKKMKGLEVSPIRIVRRKAIPNAWSCGLGILEYNVHSHLAQEEFRRLFHSIYPLIERKIA